MASYAFGFAVGIFAGATLKEKYPFPTSEKLQQIKEILQNPSNSTQTNENKASPGVYAGVLPKVEHQKPK